MFRSVLSVFAGAFGMVLKVMLVILLCFAAGYCLFSALAVPFLWSGLARLAAAAGCALLVRFLICAGRDEDQPDDFENRHPQ